ncbi:BMP family ABC transporter substrate-binding protein [Micromonospora sp. MW-13]|uniref:BMP family ABC transporter substrate-binding protein n=1 Tax=Micromonospora sp. MW-13 TaxID=2094022 RepID=UPI000E442046|nr:BMP family ABC transporter substrate-binding protein [Micromonospora sp. MW-13]
MALGLLVWLFWPERAQDPAPRERAYQAFTACLLTDDKGLAGELARATWEGMQQASLAESFKVQYLAVAGPQTEANASAYFNSLGLQRCGVVVAVGEAPVAALAEGRSRFPTARYVVVGGSAALPGVARVDSSPVTGVGTNVRAEVAAAYAAVSGN